MISPENTRRIGDILRKKRLQRNMSYGTLSKKSGLARSTLCDIEKGRLIPSIKSLYKIAAAFNEPIFELIPECKPFPESEESPPCEDSSSDTPAR